MKTKRLILIAASICCMTLVASCGGSKKTTYLEIPCSDCVSTDAAVRAVAVRESMDQQMAKQMARSSALEEMASKISVTVKSVIDDYYNSRSVNMNEETKRRFEGLSRQVVDQTVKGYRTVCEKYTVSTKSNGAEIYKCYYGIELGKDDVAKSLYKGLTNDDKLRLDYDYEKFKEEFNKQLNSMDQNR